MILPKWYYYRGGTSDRDKIMACMRHIPAELQQEVSDKYESLYLMNGHVNVTEGRAAANKYLGDKARAFRGNLVQQGQVVQPHKKEKPPAKKFSSGVKNTNPLPKGVKGIQLDW